MSDPIEPSPVELSLVIPAYNEQEVVPELLRRIEPAMRLTGKSFEVLIIDDGSTDDTPRLLSEAMKTRPWLRVVRMNRNSRPGDSDCPSGRANRPLTESRPDLSREGGPRPRNSPRRRVPRRRWLAIVPFASANAPDGTRRRRSFHDLWSP